MSIIVLTGLASRRRFRLSSNVRHQSPLSLSFELFSMEPAQLEATFDQQSASYDQQWAKLAAFRDGIHLLVASLFARLPAQARMLCVGAGTGAEIRALAARFPTWTFTAVEPSAGMLAVAQERAKEYGYADRCTFHTGYLDTLPSSAPFHCASSLLVSQFLLKEEERTGFFREIAIRLEVGGFLVSSDLASDTSSPEYKSLLTVWLRTMAAADVSPERVQQMQEAYARDVAILPPQRVATIVAAAGFAVPVQFYQAGLIHAWYTHRLPR
jgi:tRNA (cmo5U34)-methyltransferase